MAQNSVFRNLKAPQFAGNDRKRKAAVEAYDEYLPFNFQGKTDGFLGIVKFLTFFGNFLKKIILPVHIAQNLKLVSTTVCLFSATIVFILFQLDPPCRSTIEETMKTTYLY